jgi:hypothetical protein
LAIVLLVLTASDYIIWCRKDKQYNGQDTNNVIQML